MEAGRTLVGTSGWSYKGWVGPFYPPKTSAAAMLAAYAAGGLDTVEAHSTYRRRPTLAMLEKWSASVPETFRFAPKMHAAVTHQRDLEGVEQRVQDFFAALAPLSQRCGPVLFALPHRHVDLDRLDRLLGALPDGARAAFELDVVWHEQRVIERLDARGAALVVVDRDDAAGDVATGEVGDLSYVRLRRQTYDDVALDLWAERIRGLARDGRDVYAFVRHDDDGDAPRWAAALQARL